MQGNFNKIGLQKLNTRVCVLLPLFMPITISEGYNLKQYSSFNFQKHIEI